jgi:hypothetical protein
LRDHGKVEALGHKLAFAFGYAHLNRSLYRRLRLQHASRLARCGPDEEIEAGSLSDGQAAGLARYYNSCYNRASEELQACARNTYERHARQPA